MTRMRGLLGVAVLLACAILISAGSLRRSRHVSSKPLCGANEPCRWAVCAWSQQRISPDQCDFIGSDCACPLGTSCLPTINMRPVSELIVFPFRCS